MIVVKVTKCSNENSWYQEKIGSIHEVGKETYGPRGYGFITKTAVDGTGYGFIAKNDCEIISK